MNVKYINCHTLNDFAYLLRNVFSFSITTSSILLLILAFRSIKALYCQNKLGLFEARSKFSFQTGYTSIRHLLTVLSQLFLASSRYFLVDSISAAILRLLQQYSKHFAVDIQRLVILNIFFLKVLTP